ncbi:acyl-CoA dehydrogenase family protein [Sphingobium vermicomposti]|nr:acyl-CoA dehydrogenase family protein [Sphingobium vermicomposti]
MAGECLSVSRLPAGDGFVGVDRKILERASALVPLLASNAERADAERTVPQENIDALAEAGLWGLTRPHSRGGYQTNIRTTVEVVRELARGCGSTSWILMISTIEQMVMSFLPAEAQEEIYALNPDPRFCGTFAPSAKVRRVDGGIIVSGRWGWCSNSEFAHWAFMGVPILGEDGNVLSYGQALIPTSSCTIERTWNAAGLAASSSHHLHCEDIFVPDHRVFDVMAAGRGERTSAYPGTLYQSAFSASLSLMNASPMPGLAQCAFDQTVKAIPEKAVVNTTYMKSKDAPTCQVDVGWAAARLETSCMHMAAIADMIDAAAMEGRDLTISEKARARMAAGVMGKEARDAVDHLLDASGASVFLLSNPSQRAWRDLGVASRHAYYLNTICAQIYGAELLGGQQVATLL